MLDMVGYFDDGARSQILVKAATEGARRLRMTAGMKHQNLFHGTPEARIAVLYGLRGNLKSIFNCYVESGRNAIFMDLGFFGREDGGKLSGYHRVSANELFPCEALRRHNFEVDRLEKFNIKVREMREEGTGKYILLAGQSAKASGVYGLVAEEFEKNMVSKYSSHKLPVVYRPKPSWNGARPIRGSLYAADADLNDLIDDAEFVVSHHSNVGIDALIRGVPCLSAIPCPAFRYGSVDTGAPQRPSVVDRIQWLANLCYQQYTPDELRNGSYIKMLNTLGLLR